MKRTWGVMLLAATLLVAGVQAETFGTGANQFSIDFVNIGYAGNTEDTTGYGAVDYNYRIGMTEVTIDQFAKARVADSRIGAGYEDYWNDGFRTVGINAPASCVSWYEAAKFANWLTTGDAYTGVYQFDGSGTLTGVNRSFRNGNDMAYVLPSEDEWYKAAYLKSDGSAYTLYATGDSIPTAGVGGENFNSAIGTVWNVGTGIAENNGTFDMSGNVWEWNESAFDGTLDNLAEPRMIRGGDLFSYYDLGSSFRLLNGLDPADAYTFVGFRVAAIPEPSSIAMIGLVSGCTVFIRRRFMI